MAQSVGELFINLGVKGSEKSISAFASIKQGMGDIASMALETKAAILGAAYAIEQFISKSAGIGTSLQNFKTLTGISPETRQKLEYAAQQSGAAPEETDNLLMGILAGVTKQLTKQGNIPSLGYMISRVGHGVNLLDIQKHPEHLYPFLQEFAQKESNKGMAFQMLMQIPGMTEKLAVSFINGVYNKKNFDAAPFVTEKESETLNKVNIGAKNIASKIAVGAEKETSKIFDFFGRLINNTKVTPGSVLDKFGNRLNEFHNKMEENRKDMGISPSVKPLPSTHGNSVNIQNQNLIFQNNDGKDSNKIKDPHRKAAKEAFGQMNKVGGQ